MEEEDDNNNKKATTAKKLWFWSWALAPILLRLLLIYFPTSLKLSSRPEVCTPLTSLRRLAEGYWLKQSSMSPYAGSMYHGSPLLLSVLGPLTVTRNGGQPNKLISSLVFVIADFVTGILIRAIGQNLQKAYNQSLRSLDIVKQLESSAILSAGDVAALVYLWNPLTLVACVGSSTSPVENFFIILALYGACTRLVPLAAFGWVIATHLSFYPIALVIPVILLFGYGLDALPRKLVLQTEVGKTKANSSSGSLYEQEEAGSQPELPILFSWRPVLQFIFWASLWAFYVFILCSISVKSYDGLREMFKSTYGFILTVEDLSPNIGVLWYFFAEVFDFFRNFFLIVFHVNILFMIVPLAIRLNHRPCFLAFTYITICSMLKSYPSVGDSALYLGLLCLFVNELSDMKFSFFLFCGYVGVFLLSPVMHNLWIWRGTGNANFYFATAMVYACLQIILLVESIGAMLNHDRKLKKLFASMP